MLASRAHKAGEISPSSQSADDKKIGSEKMLSPSINTAVDAVLSHPKLHLLRRRRLLVGRGVARVAEQRAQPRVERRRHAAARSYGIF